MNLILQFILSLVLTILVEFLIFYIFIRKEPAKLLFYSLIINSFTLPIATNIYLNLINNLFLVEIGVFLAESVLLMLILRIKYKKAILISLIANSITAIMSIL